MEAGVTVQLTCSFDDSLLPEDVVVSWFKKGSGGKKTRLFQFDGPVNVQNIDNSDFAERATWNDQTHVLEIVDLDISDSGEYECEVDAFFRAGSGTGELDVKDPPVIFTSKPTFAFGQDSV